MADSMCLISICDGGEDDNKCMDYGRIKKRISCATSRGDEDFRTKLQDIMDDGGDAPSIAVITVPIIQRKG